MNRLSAKGAANYQRTQNHTDVASASPHRLVQMLMEGATVRMLQAKQYMLAGRVADKCAQISWAIDIISGLQMALDKEQGGEIAANLDNLYDYMERRLVDANVENKAEIIDEVLGLMQEIKSAWDAIPESLRSIGREHINADSPVLAAGA